MIADDEPMPLAVQDDFPDDVAIEEFAMAPMPSPAKRAAKHMAKRIAKRARGRGSTGSVDLVWGGAMRSAQPIVQMEGSIAPICDAERMAETECHTLAPVSAEAPLSVAASSSLGQAGPSDGGCHLSASRPRRFVVWRAFVK